MSNNEFSCDCTVIHTGVVEKVKSQMLKNEDFDDISAYFKVISDNTRIKIIFALDKAEMCVCDIANVLNMTKSAVSHQLNTLRLSKIVKYRKDGKTVYYSLCDDNIHKMMVSVLDHLSGAVVSKSRNII